MKNKTKILATVISLALLVSAVLGISALAADTEPVKPEIIAYNVSHENNYKLMFAVDKTTVAGDNLKMVVKDSAGNLLDEQSYSDKNAAPTVTVADIPCYKLTSKAGIAPADIAMQLYITVSTTVDGEEVVADTVRYSLAEYCYQRLILEGFAWTTDEDDMKRAQLYANTLMLGASSQDVLRNLNSDATDDIDTLVTEMAYYYIDGFNLEDGYNAGIAVPGEITVTLPEYEGSEPFKVWNVAKLGDSGKLEIVASLKAGEQVVIDNHTVITPSAVAGVNAGGEYFNGSITAANRVDFSDGKTPGMSSASKSTATVIDGDYLEFKRNGDATASKDTNQQYIAYYMPKNLKPEGDGVISIAEFDIAFGGSDTTGNAYLLGITDSYARDVIYLRYDSTKERISFVHGTTNGNLYEFAAQDGFETDTWYNIRIEVYNSSVMNDENKTVTEANVIQKIYVNGVCIGDISTVDVKYNHDNDKITFFLRAEMSGDYVSANLSSYMLLDNIFCGYDTKSYVPYSPSVLPEEGIAGTAEGGTYYNSEESGVYRNDGSKLLSNYATDKGLIYKNDGYLLHHRHPGVKYTASHSLISTSAFDSVAAWIESNSLTADALSADTASQYATVVEFDTAVNLSEEALGKNALRIDLRGRGYKGSVYFTLGANGKLTFNNYANKEWVKTAEGFDGITLNEWHTIRFEIFYLNTNTSGAWGDRDGMMIQAYVDGEFAIQFAATEYGTHTTNEVLFALQGNADCSFEDNYIALDNIYVGYTEKTYTSK